MSLTTEDTERTELKACIKKHAKEILAGFSSEELWRNYAEAVENLCRKLECERNEAREALEYIAHSGMTARHIADYAIEFLERQGAK